MEDCFACRQLSPLPPSNQQSATYPVVTKNTLSINGSVHFGAPRQTFKKPPIPNNRVQNTKRKTPEKSKSPTPDAATTVIADIQTRQSEAIKHVSRILPDLKSQNAITRAFNQIFDNPRYHSNIETKPLSQNGKFAEQTAKIEDVKSVLSQSSPASRQSLDQIFHQVFLNPEYERRSERK